MLRLRKVFYPACMITPAEVAGSQQAPAGVDRQARLMRTLLLAGFGGLLAIMLLAGITALSTLGDLHTAEEAARRDYLQRNQALTTVNFSIHIYGDRVEQYVMRSSSAPADPAFADQLPAFLPMRDPRCSNTQSAVIPWNNVYCWRSKTSFAGRTRLCARCCCGRLKTVAASATKF